MKLPIVGSVKWFHLVGAAVLAYFVFSKRPVRGMVDDTGDFEATWVPPR